jgi:signal transduction histidine kinase
VSERHAISIRDRHGFERSVPLSRTLTLGRQSHCDVVLSDSMVSRNHLRIEHDGSSWWMEDLNTSHGTYMRDQRISRLRWEPGTTIRLADGAYFLTLKHETSFASEVNLQAVLQTAHLLTGEVELDDLLEQTLDRLLAISGTDRGFIMLPENGELEVKVQRNLGKDMEKDIHLSMSSVYRVFEQGEPIWIHNVAADEQLMLQQSIMDLQLKTILCLPLVARGKTIGVSYLDSRHIITEPVDRPTFEAIVSLCAVAIERGRLAEENFRNQVLAKVGQVASSIVHDFKNALFVIAGHGQMLGAISTTSQMEHHVAQILSAVDRLSRLSTDVLDYAKVREPKREPVDLRVWLGSLIDPLQPRAAEMGITLRLEGERGRVHLDRFRFARVIENLMANALDALKNRPGGSIVLRWEVTPQGTRLAVEDTGKGIPRKVMRHIFEPFYSYGKSKGTGLGMATVKKIVEEHDGQVEVLSEEGRGTTVTILLPELAPATSPLSEDTTGSVRVPGAP